MAEYRRKKDGTDAWHWCKNCSGWPTSNYEVEHSNTRPTTGELCNQCRAKEAARQCS